MTIYCGTGIEKRIKIYIDQEFIIVKIKEQKGSSPSQTNTNTTLTLAHKIAAPLLNRKSPKHTFKGTMGARFLPAELATIY